MIFVIKLRHMYLIACNVFKFLNKKSRIIKHVEKCKMFTQGACGRNTLCLYHVHCSEEKLQTNKKTIYRVYLCLYVMREPKLLKPLTLFILILSQGFRHCRKFRRSVGNLCVRVVIKPKIIPDRCRVNSQKGFVVMRKDTLYAF